jgi:hypothetical protein
MAQTPGDGPLTPPTTGTPRTPSVYPAPGPGPVRTHPRPPVRRHRVPPPRRRGGGGGGGVPPPVNDPIRQPMTYEQLQQQVADEVASQINAENAPLKAQADTLGGQETAAQKELQSEQAALMPYIQHSADQVGQFNKDALSMEQSVFQAAGSRMSSMQQDQAAEAQKLAQQMGGPVATGEFTEGLQPFSDALPGAQATNMLEGLGIASAGNQEAQQFAGQVFPALMTEEQAKSKGYFEDQIKTLRDQITQNASGKSALIGSTLADALDKERTFELNVKTAQLDKLKANRDWQATKTQLAHDSARLGLSKKASALSEAGVTGRYKGKPTMEAIKLSADQRLQAQRLGLSATEFQQRLAASTMKASDARAKDITDASQNAASFLDSAMNPNGGKPITRTTKHWIPHHSPENLAAASGRSSQYHYDPQRKQWYLYQRETLTPEEWAQRGGYSGPTPITDPNRLYNLVRGEVPNLPKKALINLVRAKTGQQNWSPGQKTSHTGEELHSLTRDELMGIAADRGLRRPTGKWGKQQLIDYILHTNPSGP